MYLSQQYRQDLHNHLYNIKKPQSQFSSLVSTLNQLKGALKQASIVVEEQRQQLNNEQKWKIFRKQKGLSVKIERSNRNITQHSMV